MGEQSSVDELAEQWSQQHSYQYDVFISYSTKQEAAAKALAENLSVDLKSFYAPNELQRFVYETHLNQWVNPLRSAMIRSCHYVALLSHDFFASAWCELEMHGFFNLWTQEQRRTLRFYVLDDCTEKLPSRLKGFLFRGDYDALLRDLRQTAASSTLKPGMSFGRSEPRCFRLLLLRELHEPPTRRNRPPWGKDSRSPRGVPGAPPYDFYEDLVRECMVQVKRTGQSILLAPQIDLQITNLQRQYVYIPRDANRHARQLLSQGISPFSFRPGFLERREDVLRALQGKGDDPELYYYLALALVDGGRPEEAVPALEQAIRLAEPPPEHFHALLARAHYDQHNYEQALAITQQARNSHSGRLLLVHAATLAQLGRTAEAQAAIRNLLCANPVFSLLAERSQSSYEHDPTLEHWIEGLQKAGCS